MKRLGLIVNPIAGLGGRVGLKGTDGAETLRRARALGARPESPTRAEAALRRLGPLAHQAEILTCPGLMGEVEVRACGLEPRVLGGITADAPHTTAAHTISAARAMVTEGVDLLLFAGGDGTARDICGAIGLAVLALGIPAGVKMHSAVYATSPGAAGDLAALFVKGLARRSHEAEVMDIDEEAFRDGRISARLYGYLRVPLEPRLVQNLKAGSGGGGPEAGGGGRGGGGGGVTPHLHGLAARVVAEMGSDPDCLYIIGPGTTTRAITDALRLPKTLLGVDVILNGSVVAADATEKRLLELLAGVRPGRAKVIVTVIGGQGYIFGRGNQQLSHRVLRAVGRENIIVVADKEKILSLAPRPLLVDTGDEETDRWLSGHVRVVTGYGEQVLCRVSA